MQLFCRRKSSKEVGTKSESQWLIMVSETRYIVTNITIDSAKEFKNGAIVKRPDAAILNTKLRGILQQYQNVVDELLYVNGLTCPELVFQIKNGGNKRHRTLASVVEEYISNSNLSKSSVRIYQSIWRRVTRHLDGRMLMENINHANMLGLQRFLFSLGLNPLLYMIVSFS